jgi:hypothetical protein
VRWKRVEGSTAIEWGSYIEKLLCVWREWIFTRHASSGSDGPSEVESNSSQKTKNTRTENAENNRGWQAGAAGALAEGVTASAAKDVRRAGWVSSQAVDEIVAVFAPGGPEFSGKQTVDPRVKTAQKRDGMYGKRKAGHGIVD